MKSPARGVVAWGCVALCFSIGCIDWSSMECANCLDIEAETGMLTAGMEIRLEPNASAGEAIASPTEDVGAAAYSFTVTVAADYIIWARVVAANDAQNSFIVLVDEEILLDPQTQELYTFHIKEYGTEYRFHRVTVDDGLRVRTFAFSEAHVLTVRARERNTVLDRLIIVPHDSTFKPE
jgi:hypothetical protein